MIKFLRIEPYNDWIEFKGCIKKPFDNMMNGNEEEDNEDGNDEVGRRNKGKLKKKKKKFYNNDTYIC